MGFVHHTQRKNDATKKLVKCHAQAKTKPYQQQQQIAAQLIAAADNNCKSKLNFKFCNHLFLVLLIRPIYLSLKFLIDVWSTLNHCKTSSTFIAKKMTDQKCPTRAYW